MQPFTDEDVPFVITSSLLMGIVCALDILLPLGIVIWVLYLCPVGFSSYCSIRWFSYLVPAICSTLIIVGYYYSPAGISPDIAIINRGLGILMVWIGTFFLNLKRV